ncbi:MAG: 2-polyprenyl-3-methyl-6-methoxy-1,4-benzoquinone monooxygenase, partial [Steroidobacteraceae bacterium]
MDPRVLSPLDRLLELADNGLRSCFARPSSNRPTPGNPTSMPVDPGRRRHAAGLMRVNHAGEIAAQGL